MSPERLRNLAASIHQRLLNLAHERSDELQLLLTQFALERLLYRLSRSAYRDTLVLKGAMLFHVWADRLHRPTRDLDFLGYGDNNIARFEALLRELCVVAVEDDGLLFLADTVRGNLIKEGEEYEGLRLQLQARLGAARIPIQIDIGFGDVVTPAATEGEYPVLLSLPAPVLRMYSKESVIAEKFEAMVKRGLANSRMKDFYDVWVLSRTYPFQAPTLSQAIIATFNRRRTEIPNGVPLALSAQFAADPGKQAQWQAFLRRGRFAETPLKLTTIVSDLAAFLVPLIARPHPAGTPVQLWQAGGPWTATVGDV